MIKPGHDDRADDRREHFEVLEQLEQEQKVVLGPGGGVVLGRVGRRAELGAKYLAERHVGRRTRVVAEHQHEHDDHHRQAGDRVAEHLLGPEGRVRLGVRLAGLEAVAAEQGDVDHGANDQAAPAARRRAGRRTA